LPAIAVLAKTTGIWLNYCAVSNPTVRILEAAAVILGGEDKLARYLNVGDELLRAYLEDRQELPDLLLLRTVDVILDNIRSMIPPNPEATQSLEQAIKDLKSRSA
jgi:hypothetical protein